jgi:hypothetical protein
MPHPNGREPMAFFSVMNYNDSDFWGGAGIPSVIVAWSLQFELVFYAASCLFRVSPFWGLPWRLTHLVD